MTLPYKDVRKSERTYQAWDTDAYNFFVENCIDMTPYVNPGDFTVTTNLRFYPLSDGSALLLGSLVYVPAGPTGGTIVLVAPPLNVIDLSACRWRRSCCGSRQAYVPRGC